MKGLMYAGLSASVLALTTIGAYVPAQAEPITSTRPTLESQAQSNSTFEFTAPIIAKSGALGSNHFIRVAVIGMSLKDVMISLPPQMEKFQQIEVKDQNGKTVSAKITKTPNRITLAFAEPVTPGNTLEVLFTGVEMRGSGGDILLYGVTAERVGTKGEIPVGTARIQLPSRS